MIPPVAACVVRLLFLTTRRNVGGMEHLEHTLATRGRVILAVWHECVGMAIWQFRGSGFHALTSYSYDGELAARIAGAFGVPALRGSSSAGGVKALQQLEKALELGITVGFTIDGPRGPRRVAKPGIAVLSARTGLPVIPIACAANPAWRLRSWDRFAIPKPFAKVHMLVGPPVSAEGHGSIEAQRAAIEAALNLVQTQVESELDISRTAIGLDSGTS